MKVLDEQPESLALKYVLKIKAYAREHSLAEILSYQQEEKENLYETAERLGVDSEALDTYIEQYLIYSEKKLTRMIRSRRFHET